MSTVEAVRYCINLGELSVALGTVWREGREFADGGLQRAVQGGVVGAEAVVEGIDAGIARLLELRLVVQAELGN